MSESISTAVEASAAVTSSAVKATVAGGGASVVGKITGIDPITALGILIGVSGLLISLLGFLVTWYYKKLDNQRKDELHRLEVQKLKGECRVKN